MCASALVGLVIYLKTTPADVWLVEYEYQSKDLSKLQDFAQTDTVFLYKEVLCRNETGSIADTLVDEGIRRHELKIQHEQPSKEAVVVISDELLTSDYVTVINHRFRDTRKDKSVILYWILFGFLAGMMLEFILTLVKKPGSD